MGEWLTPFAGENAAILPLKGRDHSPDFPTPLDSVSAGLSHEAATADHTAVCPGPSSR